MKKNLIFAVALSLSSTLTFTSCEIEEDKIVDWSPVNIEIEIRDSQCNDLLDKDDTAHFVGYDVSFTYKGKTYKLDTLGLKSQNNKLKEYFALFRGVDLCQSTFKVNGEIREQTNYLRLGEIDGSVNMEEDIEVNWSDGTKDVITYHCSNHNEKNMTCDRWYKLNGVKTDNPIIIERK